MSADRETNHDMAHDDIALLLAEAADGVEIGIAPTDAVVRGGRRRRARRWAVATATALVIVGTTGTLAPAGMPGGSGDGADPAVTAPSETGTAGVFAPHRTLLAHGTEQGKPWKVFVDVWTAPRDESEAQAEVSAMAEYAEMPVDVSVASDLVGRTSYFAYRGFGDKTGRDASWIMHRTVDAQDAQTGTDLESGALALDPASDGPQRLVVGHVARTARQVTCTWKDGTTTVLGRDSTGGGETPDDAVAADEFAIRPAEGSLDDWFVCLAPKGTSFKSAEVTK
ncbi:hypothetical protein ACFV0T_21480 [Streptomyces sp. NPDC059582]|uniref:hypothetical protein n=1 Tax=Streptomyces sp. NPDC059582 TaxID=3346875 RepID=UPI0036AD83FF